MRGKEPVALPLLSITMSPLPTLIANFSPVTHFPVFPFKTVCLFFFPTWIVFGALSWALPVRGVVRLSFLLPKSRLLTRTRQAPAALSGF